MNSLTQYIENLNLDFEEFNYDPTRTTKFIVGVLKSEGVKVITGKKSGHTKGGPRRLEFRPTTYEMIYGRVYIAIKKIIDPEWMSKQRKNKYKSRDSMPGRHLEQTVNSKNRLKNLIKMANSDQMEMVIETALGPVPAYSVTIPNSIAYENQ